MPDKTALKYVVLVFLNVWTAELDWMIYSDLLKAPSIVGQ